MTAPNALLYFGMLTRHIKKESLRGVFPKVTMPALPEMHPFGYLQTPSTFGI